LQLTLLTSCAVDTVDALYSWQCDHSMQLTLLTPCAVDNVDTQCSWHC